MRSQFVMNKLVVTLALFVISSASLASDFYMGVDAVYQQIKIADASFKPASVQLRGGLWLWRGIAVEASVTAGVSDDSDSGLTLEVPTIASVYARFQSPDDLSLRAYILLGYSSVELEGSQVSSSFPGTEGFYGPSVAIGFQENLSFLTNTALNLQISGHFIDDDIDVTSISLGLQYDF